MKRIYVNEKWCLGCHLCEYNCAFSNSGGRDMATTLMGASIRPNIRVEEGEGVCYAVSCRHCEDPLCVKGCIGGALSIENGVIEIDKSKCIHCYTCIVMCPYGAVMPSEDGAVQKCELCIKTKKGTPACVAGCPNGAIVFEER